MATQSSFARAAFLLALAVAAGCSPDGQLPTAPDASEAYTPFAPTITIVVCKVGDAATVGTAFTFNTSANNATGRVTPQVSVRAQAAPGTDMGKCRQVWAKPGGADYQTRVTIAEVVPDGYDLTSVKFVTAAGDPPRATLQDPPGNSVTVTPGKWLIVVFNNSSVAPPPPPPSGGRIGDFAWRDANRNGLQDAGEPGLPGVVVVLRTTTGVVVATTTSNAAGAYSFTGVAPGCYFAEAIAPSGFAFTNPDAGDDALDSDVDPATGTTPATCVFDSEDLTFDIGFVPVG